MMHDYAEHHYDRAASRVQSILSNSKSDVIGFRTEFWWVGGELGGPFEPCPTDLTPAK